MADASSPDLQNLPKARNPRPRHSALIFTASNGHTLAKPDAHPQHVSKRCRPAPAPHELELLKDGRTEDAAHHWQHPQLQLGGLLQNQNEHQKLQDCEDVRGLRQVHMQCEQVENGSKDIGHSETRQQLIGDGRAESSVQHERGYACKSGQSGNYHLWKLNEHHKRYQVGGEGGATEQPQKQYQVYEEGRCPAQHHKHQQAHLQHLQMVSGKKTENEDALRNGQAKSTDVAFSSPLQSCSGSLLPGQLEHSLSHPRPSIRSHFCSPARKTPSKPLRSLNFSSEGPPCTPSTSSQRKCPLPLSGRKMRLKAAMKLKALENESKAASFQEQNRRDAWLNVQEKAYCAWLNHVLLKPMKPKDDSGDMISDTGSIASYESSRFSSFSDTSYLSSESALTAADSPCGRRTPRYDRRRGQLSKLEKDSLLLDASLQALCSIPVLRRRLEPFLDSKSREDVIATMINLARHIDEGRLKMRDGCIILTDVALKEKCIQAMLSYNTPWLKIGLHVVLGHNALLSQEKYDSGIGNLDEQGTEDDSETQNTFLKLVIEKHFLAHTGLAKYHATNKTIEGLYKAGYRDALGRVIFKRLLLFVLTLDKAKAQNTLSLACGIDGLDGGSPLLFHTKSRVKSSRQALQECLLEAMHGEGDIVGHLGVLGYHVMHVQGGLADYTFETTNLIEDLQDGVRFCRLVQVLLRDPSVLMKMKLPSDRLRRRSHNCQIALERLAKAGVPLLDDFGCQITAEDLVEGDRERVIALLWNVMLHLQIPQLVSPQELQQEICRIRACSLDTNNTISDVSSLVDLLLEWVQVISNKYGISVKNFSTSFADGRALCCTLNYYFPKMLPHTAIQGPMPFSLQKHQITPGLQILDQSTAAANIILFQNVICKLGGIPEVLPSFQPTDVGLLLCDRNIIILMGFLFFRILHGTPGVEEKMDALGWDAGLAFSDSKVRSTPAVSYGSEEEAEELQFWKTVAAMKIQSAYKAYVQRRDFCRKQKAIKLIQAAARVWLVHKCNARRELLKKQQMLATTTIQANVQGMMARSNVKLSAARICKIQSQWRGHQERLKFLQKKRACVLIQATIRKFLARKKSQAKKNELHAAAMRIQSWWRKGQVRKRFLKQRNAAIIIQSHFRASLQRQHYKKCKESVFKLQALAKGRNARKRYWKKCEAARRIQRWWCKCQVTRRKFLEQRAAAMVVQSYFRAYIHRQRFRKFKESVIKLQALFRGRYARGRYWRHKEAIKSIQCCWRSVLATRFLKREATDAARLIQSRWRQYLSRKWFLETRSAAILLQAYIRGHLQRMHYLKCKTGVVRLQAVVRSSLQRKKYCSCLVSLRKLQRLWKRHNEQRREREAVTLIQAWWRRHLIRKHYLKLRAATIYLQNRAISNIYRKRYLQLRETAVTVQSIFRGRRDRILYGMMKQSLLKIQASFRSKKVRTIYLKHRESVIKIQALFRSRRERKHFIEFRAAARTIQAYFRTWLSACQNLERRKLLLDNMCMAKAATTIQAHYKGWRQRQCYLNMPRKQIKASAECKPATHYLNGTCDNNPLMDHLNETHVAVLSWSKMELSCSSSLTCPNGESSHKSAEYGKALEVLQKWFQMFVHRRRFLRLKVCVLEIQRQWRSVLRKRSGAAVIIQHYFRSWIHRKAYLRKQAASQCIQAFWKGFLVRHRHGHFKHELSDLRQRMQNTAANVDTNMRLENRLTEALAALLTQKTVSGILHICATIDLATQHSKLCCERLLAAGAIPKILQLIQTTNRSPPHEEILKHALSILANLARYPEYAALVADSPGSVAIIGEQLLRNNEEIVSKVVKLLQLVCKLPKGLEAVRKRTILLKRLHNLSQALEKKVEVEARALARLPQTAPAVVRRSGEKKVNDAIAQHHSVVLLLQAATGEDLQARLKAVKRASSIYVASASAVPRLSLSRFPLQDCSNH